MNILVFLKQVPDTQKVRIDPVKGTLIRKGVPSITNPFDESALELGLELRGKAGGTVTALTMGIPDAECVLRDALTLGADRGILLTHRAFAGADTLATSYALSRAVLSGSYDLLLFGKQAIDGDTAQVGPEVAGSLGIPIVTFVQKLVSVDETGIVVERMIDSGRQVVRADFPAALSVTRASQRLRIPTFANIQRSFSLPIDRLGVEEIGADPDRCGLTGSPTRVKKVFTPKAHAQTTMLDGTPEESARELASVLSRTGALEGAAG
jgi:electron transfer flavoprotein beta subunit